MDEVVAVVTLLAIGLITLWLAFKIFRFATRPRTGAGDKNAEKIPRRFRRGIIGTARDVEKAGPTGEGLSFRLERNDSDGNIVELIPIEMRGGIEGQAVRDGDEMVVLGHRNRRGLLIPNKVFDVTSQLEVKVSGGLGFFAAILYFPLGLLFIASWPAVIWGVVLMFSSRDDDVQGGLALIVGGLLVMIIFYFLYLKKAEPPK